MGICLGGDKEKSKGLIRILILGISGSGKSTFSKQMKIIYTEGFSDEERLVFVNIVRSNVLIGIKELAEQTTARNLEVEEKRRKYIRFFKENNVFELVLTEKNVLKKVKSLWEDPAIQDAWSLCKNYQVQVSQLDYFIDNLERITESEFLPNNEDIVRARQRTAGAYSTRFNAFKFVWEIIDVGGQIPERKKWTEIVKEGFASIIYFASLDEYNMESSEVEGKTKMEVSLGVFEKLIADPAFKGCTILFLTKLDLFKEKIFSDGGRKEFEKKFPDFKSFYKNEFDPKQRYRTMNEDIETEEDKLLFGAIKYIERMFAKLVPEETGGDNLVVFPFCTIDTAFMGIVFEAMKEYIFVERLKNSGIKW
jgi:guanine nucleotide-binding protein subunit alpha